MYVLILMVFFNGNQTVNTVEYKTKAACEDAMIQINTSQNFIYQRKAYIATECTAKG